MLPLQLSSTPLQISLIDIQFGMHWIAPDMQCVVPGAHAPGIPIEHTTPPPGLSSSAVPLQLSSVPLQISVVGRTSPVHVPNIPPEQVCVPSMQSPTPDVPVGPP